MSDATQERLKAIQARCEAADDKPMLAEARADLVWLLAEVGAHRAHQDRSVCPICQAEGVYQDVLRRWVYSCGRQWLDVNEETSRPVDGRACEIGQQVLLNRVLADKLAKAQAELAELKEKADE